MLPYIKTVPQGEDIVIEDWPPKRPIKEKKQGDKPPPPKMIMTGSANLVLIVSAGLVRPMQIPVGSVLALPVPKTSVASAARVSKLATPTILVL